MSDKTTIALWAEYQQQEAIFWENAQKWTKTFSPEAQAAYSESRERMKAIFAELDKRQFFKQNGKHGGKA